MNVAPHAAPVTGQCSSLNKYPLKWWLHKLAPNAEKRPKWLSLLILTKLFYVWKKTTTKNTCTSWYHKLHILQCKKKPIQNTTFKRPYSVKNSILSIRNAFGLFASFGTPRPFPWIRPDSRNGPDGVPIVYQRLLVHWPWFSFPWRTLIDKIAGGKRVAIVINWNEIM